MTDIGGSARERELVDSVVHPLSEVHGVRGIALGGSRARGRARPDSDWDFGVFVSEEFSVEAVRSLAANAGWNGHVAELGEWGPVMNGGAWLRIDGVKVDLMWRELTTIDRLIEEAERGVFSVVRIPFFVAGMPSYLPVAELSFNQPVWGSVPSAVAMPPALRERGASWWRENARFDLDYATTMLERGEGAIALGLLVRTTLELAHSRMCEAGRWVLNEKGLLADAGLGALDGKVVAIGANPEQFDGLRDQLIALLEGGPVL